MGPPGSHTLRRPRRRGYPGPSTARTGQGATWIVDLEGGCGRAGNRPVAADYDRVVNVNRGGTLTPSAFPDVIIEVSGILGIRD
ncbi:MAG TPA: hypothetical protein VE623_13505 [Acidimicrobiales bacterium]|nr:hypothetical protein [Acidimicrobiales bacterium]